MGDDELSVHLSWPAVMLFNNDRPAAAIGLNRMTLTDIGCVTGSIPGIVGNVLG